MWDWKMLDKKVCSGCGKEIPDNIAFWIVEKLFFCGKKCYELYIKNTP